MDALDAVYKVFHYQPLYPGLVLADQGPIPAAKLDWPVSYKEVAHVEAKSLEEVYFKTQHLETVWWHNPGVKALYMSRSTSMGDVIQDEVGDLWAVALIGFAEVIEAQEEEPSAACTPATAPSAPRLRASLLDALCAVGDSRKTPGRCGQAVSPRRAPGPNGGTHSRAVNLERRSSQDY
ncbi:MAG: hypothetical protein PVG14_00255 [Anaerolineales bacterium]